MRFLVVDGGGARGKTLGRVLERLGHVAIVVRYIGEVPESTSVDHVDGVVLAIETRAMSGLELAQEVRLRAPWLPIAFLAGDVTDTGLLEHATRFGPVLPRWWTESDVMELLVQLAPRRRRWPVENRNL